MSYNRTNQHDGDVITQGKLNNIENGIYDLDLQYEDIIKDKLNKLEKALLILKLDKIKDLEEISKGDEDLMEAVERIKDATFDINTIGLYDAELDRKWKEEAKIAYYNKIAKEDGREEGREEEQSSIITNMLNNGITPIKITEMTGIPLEKVKRWV